MPKFKVLKKFSLGGYLANVGTIVQMSEKQGEEWIKSGHVTKMVSQAEIEAQKAKDAEAERLKAEAKAKEEAEAEAMEKERAEAEAKVKMEAEENAEKARLAASDGQQ